MLILTNPDHIVVPDAQFLFTAHFHRAGHDLVLTGADGHKLVIPGYFASEQRPALIAPNGASLPAHLIDLLAGSPAANEYAQAGPITPPEPIGRVEKIVGTVTVIRNGVAVALNVGDAVYKSDVVQTGANSSCGVAFPDGSAFNLVANTRMALNEYSYDPNSTSNSALFNLVEGGLSFVAGKVAHTGDMKIGTPVASLGIRGTAGWLYEDQVANITAQAGNVTVHFAAVYDTVTNTPSTYSLYAVDANGQLQHDVSGNLVQLAQVSSNQNGLVTTLTGNGANALPSVAVAPPDITQQQFQNIVVPQVINMAVQAIQQYQNQQNQQNNANPNSTPSNSGSSTPPPSAPSPDTNTNTQIQLINLNTAPILTTTTVTNTPTNIAPPPLPTTQQQLPQTPTSTGTATYTWNPPSGSSPQPFNNPPNWQPPSSSPPSVPGSTDNVVDNSPTPLVVSDFETINQLTVGTGAQVQVVGSSAPGSLTVTGTTSDSGTITSDSTTNDPVITFEQAATITAGGVIEAIAGGNSSGVIFASSVAMGTGATVEASGNAAFVTFSDGVTVASGALVDATGFGASVDFLTSGTVDDSGTILASGGGAVIVSVPLTVESGGLAEANGSGSSLLTSNSVALASGATVEALGGGASVTIDDGVSIGSGATVEASGTGASVYITNVSGPVVTNAGTVLAEEGGAVTFFDVQVENASGTLEATGAGSLISLSTADIVGGMLETGDLASAAGGVIAIGAGLEATFFDGSTSAIPVTVDALVQVNDGASFELLGSINGDGLVSLTSGATLLVAGAIVDGVGVDNSGTVSASDGAVGTFEAGSFTNEGGGQVIAAGTGSLISLSGDLINESGAIVLAKDGGIVNITPTGGENDGTIVADNATVTLNLGDAQNADGGGNIGTMEATDSGTFTLTGGEGQTFENSGTLEAESGGAISVQVAINNVGGEGGQVTVSGAGSFIDFLLGITGGGATISDGGKLEYGWSSNVDTNFDGPGTLVLDHQSQNGADFATGAYTATISGFGLGDAILLTDLVYSSTETDVWNSAVGTLTVKNGATSAILTLAGAYNQNNFALESDAFGNIEVVYSPLSETVSPITVNENASVTLSNYVVVSDTPNTGDVLTTTLTVTHGTITSGETSGSTLTLTGTAAAINADLATATYSGGANYYGSDSLQVTTSDGTSGGSPVSQTAAITVVETTALSETVSPITVNENASVTLSNYVVVSDTPNTGDVLTTTLTVTHGTITSGETSGSTLTLTGTAAAINADLATATYSGGANYYGSDSLQVTTSDGTSGGSPVSQTAAITVVETTALSETVSPITVNENASVTLSNYVVVSDTPNTGDVLTTTLTVTHGTITSGETSGSTLTLTGTAAAINADLATATYSGGANYYGSDSLQVTTSDGTSGGSPVSQTAAITVVETTALSETVSPITVNENASVTLSNYVVVSDTPNTGDVLTTTLTVTHGTITSGETSGSTLTLTGTAAAINADLATATYSGGANYYGSDSLQVTTSDGTSGGSPVSQTAAITVVETTALSETVSPITVNENASVTLSNYVVVSDTPNTGDVLTTTLTVTHGTITSGETSGSTLTLTGTAAAINADLATATYSGGANYYGSDSLQVTTSDGTSGGSPVSQTAAITVVETTALSETVSPITVNENASVTLSNYVVVSDTPNTGDVLTTTLTVTHGTITSGETSGSTLTLTGTAAAINADLATATYSGGANYYGSDSLQVTTSDGTSGGSPVSQTAAITVVETTALSETVSPITVNENASVTLSNYVVVSDTPNTGDVLTTTLTVTHGTITSGETSGSTLTLTGTAAAINADLATATYSGGANYYGSDSLQVTTSDGTSGGSPVSQTAAITVVETTALSETVSPITVNENASVTLSNYVVVSDTPNTGDVLTTTLTVTHGTITSGETSGSTLTLTGTAAAINADLATATYSGGANYYGSDSLQVTTSDGTSGGSPVSQTAAITVVETTALSETVSPITVNENASVTLSNYVVVSDTPNTGDVLTTTLTVTHGTITSGETSGSTLTLTGTAAAINADLATATYSGGANYYGSDSLQVTTSDGTSGGSPVSQTAAITVVETTALSETVSPITVNENASVTLSNYVVVSDTPNTGDVLTTTLTVTHGTITSGETSGSTLTLTGTAAAINADLATATYSGGANYYGSDSLQVTTSDGTSGGSPVSQTAAITVVETTALSETVSPITVNENASVTLSNYVVVSDTPNTGDVLTTTLTVTHGTITSGETSGSTLTLTGTAAAINADLATATYSGGANYYGSDSLQVTTSDGTSGGSPVSQTAAITVVETTALSETVSPITVNENASVTLSNYVVVSDTPNTGDVLTTTLTVTHGTITSGETSGSTLTLTGTAAAINADLATATYSGGANYYGSDSLQVTTSDGTSGGSPVSQTAAITVVETTALSETVSPITVNENASVTLSNYVVVSDTPNTGDVLTTTLTVTHGTITSGETSGSTLTLTGTAAAINADLATATYSGGANYYGSDSLQVTTSDGTSGGSPVSQTAAITVVETTALSETVSPITVNENASVTLSNYVVVSDTPNTGDVLTTTLTVTHGTITSGETSGSTLTLTGTAAAINADLATATYSGGANYYGSDSLQVTTSDGTSGGSPVSQTAAITVVETTALSETVSPITVNENASVTLSNYVVVSDTPNTGDVLTTTLTVTHGTITSGETSGSTLTLTGTAAAINADLATATYSGGANYYGSDSLQVTTSDGTSGGSPVSQTAAITVVETTALSETVSPITVNENASVTLSNYVVVSDTPNTGDVLTTTLTVTHGTITSGETSGSTLTLTGTAAAINADLATATYSGGANYYGSDSLQVTTSDGTSGGSPVSQTAAITVVETTALSETVSPITVNENASVTLSNYVVVSDTPNTGDVLTTTLTVTHGTITSGETSGSTLTLTGTAAAINADLATATYSGGANYYGSDSLQVTTSDSTSGGSPVSQTAAITVVETTGPTVDDWTGNASDGLWSDGGNWDNGVPTSNSEVNVSISDAIVTFNSSASPDTIDTLATSVGTVLDITAGVLTISGADGGSSVAGSLDIGGGLDIQNSALVLGGSVTVGGLLEATDHGTLDVQTGAIDNSGTGGNGIAIDGTSKLVLDSNGFAQIDGNFFINAIELTGGGDVSMASGSQISENANNDSIVASGAVLYNVDNDVFGAGTIGSGDAHLDLYNTAGGTIDADLSGQTLTLDTGDTIHNAGLLEATSGGILQINDEVRNSGTLEADGGTLSLGADFAFANFSQNDGVTLADGGTLQLANTGSFTSSGGSISGFGQGSVIDLTDVAYVSGEYAVWTQNGGSGTLALYNGAGAPEASLNLNGIYAQGEFGLTGDGSTVNSGGPGTDVNFSYISFADGQINSNGTVTPLISDTGSVLQLTDGSMSEASSWFAATPVSVAAFTASFDYQATGDLVDPGAMADGMAFVLQNDPRGSAALGAAGSSLGYSTDPNAGGTPSGLTPSAALEFNVYAGHTQGTNFVTDDSTGIYNSTSPVDFWDTGDQIQVVVSYDGGTLTETLTDLVNGNTYSTSYNNVDLSQILGSSTAYVGFSAATGGGVSTQTVSDFTFTAEAASPASPPVISFNPTYLTFSGDGQSAVGAPPSTQTDNVTIAGWINWNGGNAIGGQEVLFYNGTTSADGYGLIVAPTAGGLDVQGLAGSQAVLDGNTALSANQWYFVTLTRADGTFHLYVDGIEQTDLSNANSGVVAIGTGDQMQIGGPGALDNNEIFSGSIADVSVWDTALTQSQIQALQGTYLSGNQSGLAGYYPLSDGSGTTAADSVNSAGNLTLSGDPAWGVNGSSWAATGGDVLENTSATLIGLNVSEANANDALAVTLEVHNGTLSISAAPGVGESGTGTDADPLVLTGTAAAIDAALAAGVTYNPAGGFAGTDSLTFRATDAGAESNPETLVINVASQSSGPPPTTDTWTGNADGFDWSNGGNWSLGSPPGSGQQAAIPTGDNPLVVSNVTLDDVTLDNGSTDGATISVASGAILALLDNTVITNGTLSIDSQSEVDVEVGSAGSGTGATFDALKVSNGLVIEVGIATSRAVLTLDDNATIIGGTLNVGTVDSGGADIDIETGQFGSGATFSNVVANVCDDLDVGGQGSNAIFTLEDGVTIFGFGTGTMTVGATDQVAIEGHLNNDGATFDDLFVDLQSNNSGTGTIQVDGVQSPVTLTLTDGTTLSGGELSIGSSGEVDVAFSDNNSPDAVVTGGLVVVNAGELKIEGDATLALGSSLSLSGGGDVVLENGSRIAEVSTGTFVTLDNVDNDISGAGTVGNHDSNVTLNNDVNGTIDANVSGATLTIDTANDEGNSSKLTNAGTLKAENGGELSVHTVVDDTGGSVMASGGFIDFELGITGGNATISEGGKLQFGWSSDVNTTFNGSGTLVLDHQDQSDPNFESASYTGTISGFGGTGDTIKLTDLPYALNPADETFSWNQTSAAGGALTITDIVDGAPQTAALDLAGTYSQTSFALTSDGSGSTEVVSSPIALSMSVLGGAQVQEGQTLAASATITDATDAGDAISYQWQSSSDGGLTWVDVNQTTSGNLNGVLSSFYQLGESDEGKLFRAIASLTDTNTDQVVSVTGASTAAVTDVAPVVTTPFSYAVDELKIVKNGSTAFDDTFANGPPPMGGLFGTNPTVFVTQGSTWSEVNSKAIMAANGAVIDSVGNDFVSALLATNTQPEGTSSGQSNSGLKENATFTVSGTFDLTVPAPSGGYGIELTNGAPTQVSNEEVQFEVQRTGSGGAVVDLVQADLSTDTFTLLQSQTLTAAQLSGNTQIELDLAHNAAGTPTIAGSFELFDNGSQTFADTFTTTAHAFNDQTYTRAELLAFSAAEPTIAGTAQAGQTLNANAATNDADATVHYQWEESNSASFTTFADIGTDSANYTVQGTDIGSYIRVVATTSDPDNTTATANSTATARVTSSSPDFWGSVTSPSQPTVGVHLYGVYTGVPNGVTNGALVGVLYGVTSSGYTDAGPDVVTTESPDARSVPVALPEQPHRQRCQRRVRGDDDDHRFPA